MNFSIVMPSLGDYATLRKVFDSFERTTKDKKNLEFLVALDEDKGHVIGLIGKRDYGFSVNFFLRPKTKDFTNDYYNWLANKTTGKLIMPFNDDAWMRTDGWDKNILRRVNEIGRTTFMLDIPDTARIKYGNVFPCFPLVSRRAMNTLGFLLCPLVRMYPADKLTWDIYRIANMIFRVNNVLIEHEHMMDYDLSKKPLMDIYKEDMDKQKIFDVSDFVFRLLSVGSAEAGRKQSKLQRIINILMENQ